MMYVIQCRTGRELVIGQVLIRLGYDIKIPEKYMFIRRAGEWKKERHLVFTGYIFLESGTVLSAEDYYKIKKADGVINFIGQGEPKTLTETERQYVNWLWNKAKPLEPSNVYVTREGQKMVMSGPLKNYRGEYVDINVRQRRAKVLISICGRKYKVTLPITII